VRVGIDGELVGDTGARVTLKKASSFMKYFNLFTRYGDWGSPKTKSLYVDDFFITTAPPHLLHKMQMVIIL
jgi:hypothetical protein